MTLKVKVGHETSKKKKPYLLHKASINWSTSSSSGVWQLPNAIHRQSANSIRCFIAATVKSQTETAIDVGGCEVKVIS